MKKKMKALVLCGGIPQIALINELKSREIYTILADMNENVVARKYADEFYPVSVLDIEAVKKLAEEKKVDFVITACADQVLLVQAKVSEMLNLPCYITYDIAKKVSDKMLMKKVFVENNIPSSKYITMDTFDKAKIENLSYPMIVKPVDSYSSRGVSKVYCLEELKKAFEIAMTISRNKKVIVEEFVEGNELTVDVYIENGKAHVLCISNLDKIPNNDKFVICRTRYPAEISENIKREVENIAQKVATAFELKNSPMLIQMITDGNKVSVIEFCARTGGGDKFKLIKQVSGFDVIKAVVDLTLGEYPHVKSIHKSECIMNEFLYCLPGIFDHLEGFEELKQEGMIKEFFQLKSKGTICSEIKSSGDRVAYFTIVAKNRNELLSKYKNIIDKIKIVDSNGENILQCNFLQ